MIKPEYELSPLKAAVIQAKLNIAAFERGILQEEDRIAEYKGLIVKWEKYNGWLEDGNIAESGNSPDNGHR